MQGQDGPREASAEAVAVAATTDPGTARAATVVEVREEGVGMAGAVTAGTDPVREAEVGIRDTELQATAVQDSAAAGAMALE